MLVAPTVGVLIEEMIDAGDGFGGTLSGRFALPMPEMRWPTTLIKQFIGLH